MLVKRLEQRGQGKRFRGLCMRVVAGTSLQWVSLWWQETRLRQGRSPVSFPGRGEGPGLSELWRSSGSEVQCLLGVAMQAYHQNEVQEKRDQGDSVGQESAAPPRCRGPPTQVGQDSGDQHW